MTALRDRLTEWLRTATPPDADLLRRFVADRDEGAFTALVERHGRMVLGVCRRVAGPADADDVFQAVFLTLARHAARLRRPAALPAWLHATAYRLSLNARRARHRRAVAEFRVAARLATDPLDDLSARELLAILDSEVYRLPEADRGAVVLCCLDGLSLDEAAARLAVTPGAVRGRLERGRARLRHNLARRGVTIPVALGAGLLLAPPAVARPLTEATISVCLGRAAAPVAVAALLAGGPRPRLWAALALGLVGVGVGLIPVARSPAPEPPAAKSPLPPRVDNHGDPLPEGAVARFGTVRYRRAGMFAASVVRPDRKTFLDVDDTLMVRTYDAATGRLLGTKKLPGKRASQFLFSQNARVLIGQIGDTSNTYHAWDVETGREIGKLEKDEPYGVFRAAISADGTKVALATLGRGLGKLHLWDLITGKDREIGSDRADVRAVCISPDGKRIFAQHDTGLRAWDVATEV